MSRALYAAWMTMIVLMIVGLPLSAQSSDRSYFEDKGRGDRDKKVRLRGDLRLRADRVVLPNRARRERFLPILRLGLAGRFSDRIEFSVSVFASAGDEEFGPRFDNENADGVELDTAYLRFMTGESGELLVGQSELPLWLTPMVWDDDLRTAGVSYAHRFEFGLDALRLAAGWFNIRHPFNSDATLTGAQLAYLIRDGAPHGAEVIVSALVFDDLEDLNTGEDYGLSRQNRRVGRRLLNDFELVEVQLAGRTQLWARPLELRLSYVQNLGADDLDEGYRADLSWSGLEEHGFEVSYTYEDIEDDAVLGAFNSDDWWFHSRFSGHLLRLEARLYRQLSSAFTTTLERRNDLGNDLERYMLDLNWRF